MMDKKLKMGTGSKKYDMPSMGYKDGGKVGKAKGTPFMKDGKMAKGKKMANGGMAKGKKAC